MELKLYDFAGVLLLPRIRGSVLHGKNVLSFFIFFWPLLFYSPSLYNTMHMTRPEFHVMNSSGLSVRDGDNTSVRL